LPLEDCFFLEFRFLTFFVSGVEVDFFVAV
jgi:hypothetical protein